MESIVTVGTGGGLAPAAETDGLVAALHARGDFYDLLSSLYFRPLSAEQVEAFAELDLAPYAQINDTMAEGANHIGRYLARRNTATRQELAVDYTAAFGGLSSHEGLYAVPVESVFTSPEGLMYQQSFHQVHETFQREGIGRAEGFDYPDDHLSLLFEYLSQQSQRAAALVQEGALQEALRVVSHSAVFSREHVANWFPRLRERAGLLLTTRFYRGVLALTQGYLEFDARLLAEAQEELAERIGLCEREVA